MANDAEKRGAIADDVRNGLPAAVKHWASPRGKQRGDCQCERERNTPVLSAAVKMWPTPNSLAASNDLNLCCSGDKRDKPNKLGWAVKWATPNAADAVGSHGGGQSRSLRTDVSGQGGQLNADWVELLMGFSQGWTDIGCEKTKEWPGWPAPLVDRDWMTPTSGQCGSTSRTSGRPLDRSTKIQAQVYVFDSENGQYDYEPPRVIQGQKSRAKRLKCLGNAVVPQQIYPIFAAIAEIERCKDAI